MPEILRSQKNKERYRIEGSLGYALRIAQKIEDKEITSIEELTSMVDEDFKKISASLSYHCKDDLINAGFAVGLFDDSLKQRTASNQENKN